MNDGQKKFYEFFMGMIKEDEKEDAEELMKQCFKAQDEGVFDKAFLEDVQAGMREMVKPEELPKLEEAMKSFASNF